MKFNTFYRKILRRKNWNLFDLSRIRIRIPGRGSADSDPHKNEADPKHWSQNIKILYKYVHCFERNWKLSISKAMLTGRLIIPLVRVHRITVGNNETGCTVYTTYTLYLE